MNESKISFILIQFIFKENSDKYCVRTLAPWGTAHCFRMYALLALAPIAACSLAVVASPAQPQLAALLPDSFKLQNLYICLRTSKKNAQQLNSARQVLKEGKPSREQRENLSEQQPALIGRCATGWQTGLSLPHPVLRPPPTTRPLRPSPPKRSLGRTRSKWPRSRKMARLPPVATRGSCRPATRRR